MTAWIAGLCIRCSAINETVESLIVRVATEALADARIRGERRRLNSCRPFTRGFSAQDSTASPALETLPDLRFKRATRVETTPLVPPRCIKVERRSRQAPH